MHVCVEEGVVIFVVVFLSGQFTNYVEGKHFTILKGKLQLSEWNEVHEINSDKWGILSVNDACQGTWPQSWFFSSSIFQLLLHYEIVILLVMLGIIDGKK